MDSGGQTLGWILEGRHWGGFWRADIGVDSGGENIRPLYTVAAKKNASLNFANISSTEDHIFMKLDT